MGTNNQIILSILTAIIVLSQFLQCKDKAKVSDEAKPAGITAVLLFTVGDVSAEQKKLTAGEIITESEVVKLGKKATCDLQIRESEAEVIIRLKAESEFQLHSKKVGDARNMQGFVKAGNVLFNVQKN